MKERPILFQSAMVRALLAGTKTQTRRALRVQPDRHHWEFIPGYELKRSKIVTIKDRCAVKFSHSIPQNREWETALDWLLCPYGQPSDRLWVRETFFAFGRWETRFSEKKGRDEWHFVDMTRECGLNYGFAEELRFAEMRERAQKGSMAPCWWKRPAIHMPRAASRINLDITEVRVQRLQEISEADAQAEGLIPLSEGADRTWTVDGTARTEYETACEAYAVLWEQINGAGSWEANPWVWAVSFRRVLP